VKSHDYKNWQDVKRQKDIQMTANTNDMTTKSRENQAKHNYKEIKEDSKVTSDDYKGIQTTTKT